MGQVQMKTELIKWESQMYFIESEVVCMQCTLCQMWENCKVCKNYFSEKWDAEDKEIKVDIQLYHSLLLC